MPTISNLPGATTTLSELAIRNNPEAVVVDTIRVRGGSRYVDTLADRNTIPSDARVQRIMRCYVLETDKTYELRGGIDNENWQEVETNSQLETELGEVKDHLEELEELVAANAPSKRIDAARAVYGLYNAKGRLPKVMATLPTIALVGGYSPSIASGVLTAADDYAKLTYMGSVPRTYAPPGPEINFVYPAHVTLGGGDGRNAGSKQGFCIKAIFGTDADKFEIPVLAENSYNKSYRIWVDGEVTAVAARNDLSDYTYQRIVVTFASAKPREIMIELDQFTSFGGVAVGPRHSVFPISPDPLRAVMIGDSYAAGTQGDNVNYSLSSFANQLSSLLGITDLINSSEGGMGYLAPGAQSGKYARQKLDTDVTLYRPTLVMSALGYNDATQGAATLQAEVTAFWNKVLLDNPNALCICIGPFRSGANTGALTPLAARIKAGVEAVVEYGVRLFYIDTIAKAYQTGTGRVGTTQTTGNSSIYIGADNIHPNQAGQDYLAKRVSEDVKGIVNALVKSSYP